MNKKPLKENNTVIKSDEYVNESGVQFGKIVGEHLALGSFIIGKPFFIIGMYKLCSVVFNFGFSAYSANIILVELVIVIGLLFIIDGCFIYRDKHGKN